LNRNESRRELLKYLAASPAFVFAQSTRRFAGLGDGPITDPEQAINVLDFEPAAENALPPAHWGYLSTGTDDDGTLRANREGFDRLQLRPRRLIDVRKIDMSTTLFGERFPSPIVIAPTGRNQAFHPEGELAVARAAKAHGHLQMLSTVASTAVEDVIAARGAPIWYQLYARYNWEITEALVRRAEAAGCTAIVLTVDLQGGSNRETNKRLAKLDDRECTLCHEPVFQDYIRTKPMFDGLDVPEGSDYGRSLSWDFVRRLRDITKVKLLIKGIVRGDDAALAADHGVDGVVVSNHGGRAEASRRSTIECLPEVVAAAGERLTILIDGGFRRGTDVFKALAMGADAVCIGRPYLWGLAAFGQPGVEAVLAILRSELSLVMRQSGTTSLAEIDGSFLAQRMGLQ